MYRLLLVCLVHDLDGGVFGFPFPPFPIFSLDSYNPLMYNVCVCTNIGYITMLG